MHGYIDIAYSVITSGTNNSDA